MTRVKRAILCEAAGCPKHLWQADWLAGGGGEDVCNDAVAVPVGLSTSIRLSRRRQAVTLRDSVAAKGGGGAQRVGSVLTHENACHMRSMAVVIVVSVWDHHVGKGVKLLANCCSPVHAANGVPPKVNDCLSSDQ